MGLLLPSGHRISTAMEKTMAKSAFTNKTATCRVGYSRVNTLMVIFAVAIAVLLCRCRPMGLLLLLGHLVTAMFVCTSTTTMC